jgi:asparagine synthase (glutamine-hydrolysing)
MMAAMPRRGPDSEGLSAWPGAVLGHKRLAILDLSPSGHQPMLSADGSTGIVFNGCIYNFQQIRAELEGLGRKFHSQCDTEVLWQGYLEWGVDALVERLRGMFAFAIWDQPRRRLTLVRDRLGVKPLMYAADDGEIAFASTVGALRSAGFGGEIDPQAVLEYLEFGFVTDSRAIYRGLHKLPAATILEWSGGEIRQRQYWKPPRIDETSGITFEEAVEETQRLLVESVRLRLISDVPIGVLLSGGIDSALVCWAMRQSNANIKAFTVRAGNDPSDESAAAAETAQILGIPHEIVDMPAHDFDLDEFTDAFSEPFSCPSAQAMLWVSRLVKPAATVLLTGDGGDDVFLGYPFFRNAWWAERMARAMPAAAAPVCGGLSRLLPRRMRRFVEYATGGVGAHVRAHDGLPYYDAHAMRGELLAQLSLPLRRIPPSLASGRRLVEDVFDYHLQVQFSGEFLPKVDGATMNYSIEARGPFLDQKLWEFAAALPAEVRFHGGALKAVLREIVRRQVSPRAALRPKQGFTVPVERWLANRWSGMLNRLRGRTRLERGGWIRPGALEGPVREAISKRWVPQQIWHLLVLEHWLEKNEVGQAPGRPPMSQVQPLTQ